MERLRRAISLLSYAASSGWKKTAKWAQVFKTIGAMAKTIPYKKIIPSIKSLNDMRKACYGYLGYREKLKKYGVIAFDL